MNTSLGKYQAYDTFIHKLDSRVKLVGMLVFMVSVFLSYSDNPFMNLTIYLGIFIILFLLGLFAKVSFLSIFRSLIGLWMMILFVLILNVFFTKPTDLSVGIAFSIGSVNVYWMAIVNMLYVLGRLVIVIMITNIFTSTTKPMEMTGALEWLFYPLSLIGVPIHKFAMAISLALRFIPTLQEETSRIMKAQASRGIDYNQGKMKEKLKAVIALIIPLFISSFTTSGQLADAMEARGYDPNAKRTRYKTNHWAIRDTLSCLFLALIVTGMVLLMVYRVDLYQIYGIQVPQVQ
jgi:energy-coupling factor transport system permease protein